MDHADEVAGHQLAKAGLRLASLLNEIWTKPVNPNDMASSAPGPLFLRRGPPRKSSAIDVAKYTRGPDAELTTGWPPRIGSCFRAAMLPNRRGIGPRGIVLDERGLQTCRETAGQIASGLFAQTAVSG